MTADVRDRVTKFVQRRLVNPVATRLPSQTLLETTGRKLPRANSFAVQTFGTNLLTICVDLTN